MLLTHRNFTNSLSGSSRPICKKPFSRSAKTACLYNLNKGLLNLEVWLGYDKDTDSVTCCVLWF